MEATAREMFECFRDAMEADDDDDDDDHGGSSLGDLSTVLHL